MEYAKKFKNFINNDPILDVFTRGNFIQDKHRGVTIFDYIGKNKEKFIKKITDYTGTSVFSPGQDFIVVKTCMLDRIFKGSNYVGNNWSLVSIEYSSLQVNQDGSLANIESQKYYLFKNWLTKQELLRDFSIDYCFILGRKYKTSKELVSRYVFWPAENKNSFDELYYRCNEHFRKLELNEYVIGVNIFPNMKNKQDYPWRNEKQRIADDINEISGIWNCNIKFRAEMHLENITDYTKLTYYPNYLVEKIIKGVEGTGGVVSIISPLETFYTDPRGLFFIDFEILTSVYDDFSLFPESNDRSYIFNIGCGYSSRNNFRFKSWVAKDLSMEEEITRQFVEFIGSSGNRVVLCHWTDIERNCLVDKMKRYNLVLDIVFLDLHKIFVNHGIVVRGCKNYKLKNIATALFKHGLVSCKWDTKKCADGLEAMNGYINYLETQDENILRDIVEYNRIDCKVLYDIWKLLCDMCLSCAGK